MKTRRFALRGSAASYSSAVDSFAIVAFVLLVLALVTVGYLLNKLVLTPARQSTSYRVSKQFGRNDIVREQPLARLIGLESSGTAADSALGTLLIATGRLNFVSTTGQFDLDIPLADVRSVELVRSHLGVATGMPLLLVRYTHAGADDSAAFHLPYADEWHLALTNLTKSG